MVALVWRPQITVPGRKITVLKQTFVDELNLLEIKEILGQPVELAVVS